MSSLKTSIIINKSNDLVFDYLTSRTYWESTLQRISKSPNPIQIIKGFPLEINQNIHLEYKHALELHALKYTPLELVKNTSLRIEMELIIYYYHKKGIANSYKSTEHTQYTIEIIDHNSCKLNAQTTFNRHFYWYEKIAYWCYKPIAKYLFYRELKHIKQTIES